MSLFTTLIYQPFFNLLIAFYIGLESVPGLNPDMGVAVIFLTLVIRIIMIPLTITATRTRKERREIEEAILQAQAQHQNPDMVKKSVRQILKGNRRVVVSEGIAFFIQIGIFFMVLRMFNTGLKGADIPLLYDFMPAVSLPFNLVFLDTFDLTKPSFSLNLIQTLTILLVEIASLIDSPFPLTRTDIVRYIIILPVASFIIFAFLPAGKKLFVITTLMFSFFYLLSNILTRTFSNLLDKMDKKTIKAAIPGSENPEQVG